MRISTAHCEIWDHTYVHIIILNYRLAIETRESKENGIKLELKKQTNIFFQIMIVYEVTLLFNYE